MKIKNILSFLLTMFMSMMGINTFAYDIAVENADGVTIYYNFINNNELELEVTYLSYNNPSTYNGDVVIPEEIIYMNMKRKVTRIGSYAFQNSTNLTSVTIPNSITSIFEGAFKNCSNLASMNITNSIRSIGNSAFYKCTGLTVVNIPNSVTTIGSYAFYGCTSLTTLFLGENISYIYNFAFADCEKLKNVFNYSLKALSYLGGSVLYTYIDKDVFNNSLIKYARLHVPSTSINEYKSTSPWSDFGRIIAMSDMELGVENVENEKIASSTYFLFNGQQVIKPQKGLNIVKNGNKVIKVIVK